jgi:hypothetical protein
MVAIDLRRRIQNQRCGDKDDAIAHFATLRTMREDLAAMGQPLEDNDFYTIVMGSLPGSYDSDPYIFAVNATSSVTGTTLSADDLILTLTEEYEHRTLKAKGGKKDENAAFYSNDSGKGKGGSSSKKNAKCYNCGKKGHFKRDCWEEGGRKEGQGPKQKGKGKGKAKGKEKEKDKDKESATVAQEKKETKPKDVEEAWMAMVCDDAVDLEFFLPEESVYDDFDVLDTDSHYEAAYSCFIEEEDRTDTSTECEFKLADLIDGIDEVLDTDHDDQDLGAVPKGKVRTRFTAAYQLRRN